ncbi:fungal hydrophobin, partial [Marasmius fiardii PR-910]
SLQTAPPTSTTDTGDEWTCSTGPVQCCNSVEKGSHPAVLSQLGLLGVALDSLDLDVGLTCTPISLIGAAINSCKGQTVCCRDNSFNGVIAVGCNNIALL